MSTHPPGSPETSRAGSRPVARTVAMATGGLVGAATVGTAGLLTYLTRLLLLPDRAQDDNVRILALQTGAQGGVVSVTLDITPDTVAPGSYGLWLPGGGYLRVGEILDEGDSSVTRRVDAVDSGSPTPGPARWTGYRYARDPRADLRLPYREVSIRSDIGMLPAWVVPAGDAADDVATHGHNRWAVLVHGRGGDRLECLRALPALHRLGITAVIPAYRNDPQAPSSPDGRYNLGLSEWRDVEAAVAHCLDQGATDVTLLGWSMGGAMALQMLDLSPLADRVGALVLDAPVIDWGDVITHQSRVNRVPAALGRAAAHLIGRRWARRLVGVHEPLDVARTNWERRSAELRHRTLLIHSVDDDVVPVGPSRALAAARPDLVRFEPWEQARHTAEWNVDRERWERVVSEFLSDGEQY